MEFPIALSGVILDRVSFHGRFVHFHLPSFLPFPIARWMESAYSQKINMLEVDKNFSSNCNGNSAHLCHQGLQSHLFRQYCFLCGAACTPIRYCNSLLPGGWKVLILKKYKKHGSFKKMLTLTMWQSIQLLLDSQFFIFANSLYFSIAIWLRTQYLSDVQVFWHNKLYC